VGVAEEFTDFAAGAAPRLRRTAFLLCGNWHTAEDLAQATLAKMFVSWRRISRQDAVYAYASRTLVNTYLASRRRRRGREVLSGWLPEAAVEPPACEVRMVVLDALATLPPKARVVVVMRYWADMSVEQVADLLGCSTGNVKSQSARALGKLRVLLEEDGLRADLLGGTAGMDETSLRALLERAVASEPPAGPIVSRSVAAGLRLRRRRRVRAGTSFAAFAAVIVAAGVALPALRTGPRPAPSSAAASLPALYVTSENLFTRPAGGAVTPISVRTGAAGRPIEVGPNSSIISTPDGRTVYIADDDSDWVRPVATATGRAGRPIIVVTEPVAMAITPDGKTLYVASTNDNRGKGWVMAISVATDKPFATIEVPRAPSSMAITPDGKTLYVLSTTSGTVTPISVATGRAGPTTWVYGQPRSMVITPDGRTVYVSQFARNEVTPISVATGKAGRPIKAGPGPGPMAITPDGRTLYVLDVGDPSRTVVPISVATGTARAAIAVGEPVAAVVTPDGRTLYVVSRPGTVVPISVATGTAGAPIRVAGLEPQQMVMTPDGRRVYVLSLSGSQPLDGVVTPIVTATNTAGRGITIAGGGMGQMAIAP